MMPTSEDKDLFKSSEEASGIQRQEEEQVVG